MLEEIRAFIKELKEIDSQSPEGVLSLLKISNKLDNI